MSSLKLLMAVSKDGFVSRGPDDDMSWTGGVDKRVFRLLTNVGGVLGAGRTTYERLPPLDGREVVCLSDRPGYMPSLEAQEGARRVLEDPTLGASPVPDTFCMRQTMSVGMFAHRHPGAWLIGGQTVALAALGSQLVDQVFLCRSEEMLGHGQKDLITPCMRPGVWTRTGRVCFEGHLWVEMWRRARR